MKTGRQELRQEGGKEEKKKGHMHERQEGLMKAGALNDSNKHYFCRYVKDGTSLYFSMVGSF